MVDRIGLYGEIGGVAKRTDAPSSAARTAQGLSFDAFLRQEMQGVRLSAHAQERLRHSRIELTPEHMERLNGAVAKAAAKGARESLILLDDLALVVSVKNRTVITAIGPDRIKENVFTNIDSAVIG